MPVRFHPSWLLGLPLLVLAAYVAALVVPVVIREVVPAVVQAVTDSL